AGHTALGSGKSAGKIAPALALRVSAAEAHQYDAENDCHFQHCEYELELARLLHSQVVQERNENGRADRDQLPPGDREKVGGGAREKNVVREKRKDRECAQDAHQSRGDCGHRRRFRDHEPCPAVEKTTQRTVSVADINVFATGLRLHGAQFSVGKRTKERQQAAHEPRQIDQLGGANSLHHLGGNQKDSAADDGSHHHRGGVTHAEIAGELRTLGRIWHQRRLQVYVRRWWLSWRERKLLTAEAPEVVENFYVRSAELAEYPTAN